MIKLAIFGGGNHKVTFKWKEFNQKEYGVEYRTQTRRGVGRIIRKFHNAIREIREQIKYRPIQKIMEEQLKYGYVWLAGKCPECIISTTTKDGEEIYKRSYQFDYHFVSYVTIEGIRRLIKGTGDNRNYFGRQAGKAEIATN